MNILFISCNYRMFEGVDCGASNRSTMFVKALSNLGHVDVVSFYKEPIYSNVDNCDVVYCSSSENKVNPQTTGPAHTGAKFLKLLFKNKDVYSYYELDKEKESVVDDFVQKKHYDIIACRYIEEAAICGLVKYFDRLVIDVDDNLESGYKRDIPNMQFRHFWNKWMINLTVRNIGKMSESFLSKVKCSFCSNQLEPPYSKSVFLHNVTTISEIIPAITETTPVRMLIVGWLDFWPNKNGVLYFVENILPKIRKENPVAELYIVGKSKDSEFLKRLNETDGVRALGFVEDINAEYKNCRVVVVPVYQGAGTSVKFVEGLFVNRPIVSTPMGARGFECICKADQDYMLAENDDEFVKKIVKLLSSVEMSTQIANNAYKVGNENFSQKRFIEIVKNTISNS